MPVGAYSGAQTSVGNGVTTVFPYGWKILDQTHITVKADGVTKALGADYTVDGVGNSNGGNITFGVPPANGVVIERSRSVPYTRVEDYQSNGDLKEETLDKDLDLREMQIQQIVANVVRAFKAPLSVTADQVLSDADWAARALKVLGFDAGGNLTLSVPAADAAAASAAAAAASAAAAAGIAALLTPRVVTVADAVAITPDADTTDICRQVNTQGAGNLTVNAPTGAPVDGQKLMLRLKCTNAQNFVFNAIYRGSNDIALPIATTAGKYDRYAFEYNAADVKWDFVGMVRGF